MKASIISLSGLFIGCASYSDYTREIRHSVYAGEYSLALDKLEKSPIKTQSRNQLLYKLEKSMILDRLDEREQSRQELLDADKLVDVLYTESISKQAAFFL